MSYGATNFERRTLEKMQAAPWICPLVQMAPSENYPDPFVRNDTTFVRDMIRLVPGQSYEGLIRTPEDGVLRLQDVALSIYEYRHSRFWGTDSADSTTNAGVSMGTEFSAWPVLTPLSGINYSQELDFRLFESGPDAVMVDNDMDPNHPGAPSEMFLSLRPRPGGQQAIISRVVPPNGALRFTITHTGDTPVLLVAGSFRGYRMRF